MPELVRLYIRHVAIGVALAIGFTALLVALNVAHLRHLILADPAGWVAVVMLVVFNAIVFSGVQFAYAVMRLDVGDGPTRGTAVRLPVAVPQRVAVRAEWREPRQP